MNEVRIGMVSWAHVHAEFRAKALAEIPGARVVAIADDDAARGRAAAERFGVADFVPDWRHLVTRDDVDVVMVHSENSRHAEQVIAAAEAGKHVFCEKPVATTVADARAMVDAVRAAGVDGTAAFVSRFSKEADRAKRIVDSGVLGQVLMTRSFIGLAGIAEIGCPPDMTAWMQDPALGGGAPGSTKARTASTCCAGWSATSPRCPRSRPTGPNPASTAKTSPPPSCATRAAGSAKSARFGA
ncbi:hypothetical protein Phou_037910 [Phytohabitans houttuyneae]|uniref:Gfo/Idh/MocA-like oxidoreductase N-terminal domain-containing protein n=1 Tax=Phytohabitans houttuyneae TaxID=1076126 RepID=A0A6V8KAY1_9ACTN|nr:hypothetical protein Phou_037910 [Phytohabitans houttuyneae]